MPLSGPCFGLLRLGSRAQLHRPFLSTPSLDEDSVVAADSVVPQPAVVAAAGGVVAPAAVVAAAAVVAQPPAAAVAPACPKPPFSPSFYVPARRQGHPLNASGNSFQ